MGASGSTSWYRAGSLCCLYGCPVAVTDGGGGGGDGSGGRDGGGGGDGSGGGDGNEEYGSGDGA